MRRAALDTNVWIEAAERDDKSARQLFVIRDVGLIEICVSQHTLTELRSTQGRFGSAALHLAEGATVLPCWPTGRISELAGPISGLAGTIAEIASTDSFRLALGDIARQGTGLRDRGALIDAIRAGVHWFVTSDKGIVGSGPRARLRDKFGIEPVRPSELVAALGSTGS